MKGKAKDGITIGRYQLGMTAVVMFSVLLLLALSLLLPKRVFAALDKDRGMQVLSRELTPLSLVLEEASQKQSATLQEKITIVNETGERIWYADSRFIGELQLSEDIAVFRGYLQLNKMKENGLWQLYAEDYAAEHNFTEEQKEDFYRALQTEREYYRSYGPALFYSPNDPGKQVVVWEISIGEWAIWLDDESGLIVKLASMSRSYGDFLIGYYDNMGLLDVFEAENEIEN